MQQAPKGQRHIALLLLVSMMHWLPSVSSLFVLQSANRNSSAT